MNNTFEQEWEQLSQRYSQSRCPKSDAALDQALDAVVAGGTRKHHIRPIWYGAIAAACLAGAIVPVALTQRAGDAPLVEVGGAKVYFKCNNDCSAANTIEMFNTLIK